MELGQIEYAPAIIRLNSHMSDEMFTVTCIHEVVHGILIHLGYNQLSDDEVFVSSLAQAIAGTFKFKEEMPWERTEVSNSKELLETALNEPNSVQIDFMTKLMGLREVKIYVILQYLDNLI